MSAVQPGNLGRTDLVGGDAGQRFNDLEKLIKNDELNLHNENPIKQIQVRHGWVIDGIQITYQGADGSTLKSLHGSKTEGVGQSTDLSKSEVVLSMFGRAGHQDYYKRKLINSIGFVIFDRSTCKVRTVGPYGNGNNSNNGEPFSTGQVYALGGYAQETQDLGLSGLYFIEKRDGQHNLRPVQIPDFIRSGTFNSQEVRDWFNPQPDSKKKIMLEPPLVGGQRPNIFHALYSIDCDHNANIRCRSVVEQSASTAHQSFMANVQSWSDTKLYSGGINYLDVPHSRGIQGGVVPHQWAIRDSNSEPLLLASIRFERAYPLGQVPKIVCALNGIDMDKSRNWRLKTYAKDVTERGFDLYVQTWSNSKLYGTGASWLAVPADAQDVAIGKFSGNTNSQNGQVKFDRTLPGNLRGICMLSAVDFECGRNLRVTAEIENLTKDGLKYNMKTWSDSVMHWAEADYIVICDK